MSELMHADIFFFITSVAVVFLSLLVCVILYQMIRILRSIRRIIDRVDAGSEIIAEDIEHFRAYVAEGSLVSQLIHFFLGHRPHVAHEKRARSKHRARED